MQSSIGCVEKLADEPAEHGVERALVVCGSTVGSTPEVIDPVTDGLGERLAGIFTETTADKWLETAVDGLESMQKQEADVLVSLGGGSSLDVAEVISVSLRVTETLPKSVGNLLTPDRFRSRPDR